MVARRRGASKDSADADSLSDLCRKRGEAVPALADPGDLSFPARCYEQTGADSSLEELARAGDATEDCDLIGYPTHVGSLHW